MNMRKLFQGWHVCFIWEWRQWFRGKTIYLTPCHIGLEAGTYIGDYIELTVVILGAGFYVKWYPPTEEKKEFMDDMNERIAGVKEQFGITEEAT